MDQRPRYRCFDTYVRSIEDVTPRMRRIVLHGDSLKDFRSDRPGQWVKLFFDGSDSGRAFTIRRWRPDDCEMTIDLVRHGQGLAGTWIATASPGSLVRLAGPRSDFRHVPGRQLFLFGDETAIPAISAIVEGLSETDTATVVLEVLDESARQSIPTSATVHWIWLVNEQSPPGQRLIAHLQTLTLDPGTAQVWIGCEAHAAKSLRCVFMANGFSKSLLHASGYWKQGAEEHIDRESDY